MFHFRTTLPHRLLRQLWIVSCAADHRCCPTRTTELECQTWRRTLGVPRLGSFRAKKRKELFYKEEWLRLMTYRDVFCLKWNIVFFTKSFTNLGGNFDIILDNGRRRIILLPRGSDVLSSDAVQEVQHRLGCSVLCQLLRVARSRCRFAVNSHLDFLKRAF